MEMKIEKKQLLCNNEYYGIQEKLDNLYKDSKNNNKFKNLVSIIISKEKSKVINLRKNFSNFLGLKLKVINKNYKQVAISHTNEKATKKIIVKIKERIKEIQKKPSIETINKYNSTILGIHNYYRVATRVSLDFRKIAFLVSKSFIIEQNPYEEIQGQKVKPMRNIMVSIMVK